MRLPPFMSWSCKGCWCPSRVPVARVGYAVSHKQGRCRSCSANFITLTQTHRSHGKRASWFLAGLDALSDRKPLTKDDRHQALFTLHGMVNFISTNFGGDGIRTEHKGKRIRTLNATLNLLPPFFALSNAGPIHPGVALLCLNRLTQPPYKINILAGIRDKTSVVPFGKAVFVVEPALAASVIAMAQK